jgi:FtsH-binding integral membrane protein
LTGSSSSSGFSASTSTEEAEKTLEATGSTLLLVLLFASLEGCFGLLKELLNAIVAIVLALALALSLSVTLSFTLSVTLAVVHFSTVGGSSSVNYSSSVWGC